MQYTIGGVSCSLEPGEAVLCDKREEANMRKLARGVVAFVVGVRGSPQINSVSSVK